jgi:phosphate transport system substrate-binding protein
VTLARRRRLLRALLLGSLAAAGCGGDASSRGGTESRGASDLLGAGATFPYPLYARWFNQYAQETGVRVNYQSIGSGGGIRQLIAGTVDFGATDVPMTDEEIARVPGGRVLHIPTVLGAVAVTYNLPGLQRPLRLSADVLADLFRGTITRWNDPRLVALNPGVPLPDRDVLVVHRSDGSGTSYIFTDYLTAASPVWAAGPGRSKDVRWPVGLGGKGNEGVAGQVKQMVGAIGYVEGTYARQNRLPVALLQNAAGRFVAPSAFEVAAAATAAIDAAGVSADLRLSIVNAPGPYSYPIASLTWMLLAPDLVGAPKTTALVAFIDWALREGDDLARELGYEPLPGTLADQIVRALETDLSARPTTSRR